MIASDLAKFFLGIFLLGLILNIATVITILVTHRRSSPVILLGGLFGVAGFWLTPALRRCVWLPMLLDPPSLFFVAVGLPSLARELWQTNRWNLVHEYLGQHENRKITIRLFHRRIFVLQQTMSRIPGEHGLIGFSLVGSWR